MHANRRRRVPAFDLCESKLLLSTFPPPAVDSVSEFTSISHVARAAVAVHYFADPGPQAKAILGGGDPRSTFTSTINGNPLPMANAFPTRHESRLPFRNQAIRSW